MDPLENPFSPGAGTPPPELVGRENVLREADILLGRVLNKRAEKSVILTGLRGVGKTVLLNEIERTASRRGYRTLLVEAHEGRTLGSLLAPNLRRLLFDLDRLAGAGNRVRRALAALKGFVGAIRINVGDIDIGIDIDPAHGVADSGDIEVDLPELFTVVAEAAEERQVAIAVLIDEIQYFSKEELSGLIMAMHRMQQRQLPLVLIGAGLPILPGLAGDSKSYAERLLSFPSIGALSKEDAIKALQGPVNSVGVAFERDALDKIYEYTFGYPYFVQEWGYQAWNIAERSPISLADITNASTITLARLDQNFFRVRFDRLTPSEKQFMRAMASQGAGPYRTSDVAESMGRTPGSIGPVRSSLIGKGMIYSPIYGEIAFTVPLFDAFMLRTMPDAIEDESQ